MNFGEALEALRDGKKVQRHVWQAKGLYLFMTPGTPANAPSVPTIGIYPKRTTVRYVEQIVMTSPGNPNVVWSVPQNDILSDDWQVIQD